MTRERRVPWLPALVGLAATGAAVAIYSTWYEPRSLRLRRFRVSPPGLPPALDGLRVGYLTDFHVGGPGPGGQLAEQAIELIKRERPDITLLGGDFFDKGRVPGALGIFDGLADLPNVYAVLGNHDLRRGRKTAEPVIDLLQNLGVTVLHNTAVGVWVDDRDVVLAGVDDPYTGHDDLDAVLRDLPPGQGPLFFLTHAPSIVNRVPDGWASIILSGHTHGGQIRLSPSQYLTPLDISWYLDRILNRPLSRHQRGFFWVRGSLLYVSNGIGATRWPMRFLSPPEVVLFELSATPVNPDAPCDAVRRYVAPLD